MAYTWLALTIVEPKIYMNPFFFFFGRRRKWERGDSNLGSLDNAMSWPNINLPLPRKPWYGVCEQIVIVSFFFFIFSLHLFFFSFIIFFLKA
jgi:hypothetical protein